MHVIAAKAVALGEALRPDSRTMRKAWSRTPRCWPLPWPSRLAIVSGGTDSHLMLVDLRPKGDRQGRRGRLERAGITCNKNGIPFDPEKPTVTSGIRLGSPAATTRGFGQAEFRQIGELIAEVLEGLRKNGDSNGAAEAAVRRKVGALCARFPVYPEQGEAAGGGGTCAVRSAVSRTPR